MRVAVIFGTGSSVDALPYRFFRWAEKQAATIGMNGSTQSTRFHEVGFRPSHYCAWDPYSEETEAKLPAIDKLNEWANKGTVLYLGGEWPIPSIRPSRTPMRFTAEWAVQIAAADLACDEIILVGCEGCGPHHRMLNGWKNGIWDTGPEGVAATDFRKLYKKTIKWAVDCASPAIVYTWPEESVLYPYPIKNLFMADKLFDRN